MFEPIRGGTRGGQAEFKWSDVSADKDREHYLGHSINAPTGRWQKNKDVHWYGREKQDTESEKQAEIRHIKQLEADALAVALGFEPAPRDAINAVPSSSGNDTKEGTDENVLQRAQEKEQKRREKMERKEEKRARKLAKLERKASRRSQESDAYQRRVARDRSRSQSPRRRESSRPRLSRQRSKEPNYLPRSSRSPNRLSSHHQERRTGNDYGAEERERERERGRRHWDMNTRRELPSRYP